MENIKREFADKNFDEKSLAFISNFIEEFDELFGKYLPRDEVIKRIKENLDTIQFSCQLKKYVGDYNLHRKQIRLTDMNDEELLKSVFFHEMIHCLTGNQEKRIVGFSRLWDITGIDGMEVVTCHGLTEGFTQYVNKKRDKKYAPELNKISYPILLEQIENLVDLIGEDIFLDIAFNRPDDLRKQMKFENDFYAEEFYEAFDIIWEKEEEIYKSKLEKESPEGRLLSAIFGDDIYLFEEKNVENVDIAKRLIIDNFKRILLSKPITTVEEFNIAYERICMYAEQLNMKIEAGLFEELMVQIENLKQSGKNMEEILEEMTTEPRILLKGKIILDEFEELSKEEILERLTQESFMDKLREDKIIGSIFEDEILGKIGERLIETDSLDRSRCLFWQLVNGLAEIIKNRGYDINALAIEYIDFDSNKFIERFGFINSMMAFNIYDSNTEKCTYLGTFYNDGDEVLEFKPYEIEKIIEEHPELKDTVILSTKLGDVLAYVGDDEYIFIDRNNKTITSKKTTYCQSKIELLQEKLNYRLSRLKRLQSLNAPRAIISNEINIVNKVAKEIQKLKNKSKILPEEIEEAVGEISLDEIENLLGDITNPEEKRREALERGIGHGE